MNRVRNRLLLLGGWCDSRGRFQGKLRVGQVEGGLAEEVVGGQSHFKFETGKHGDGSRGGEGVLQEKSFDRLNIPVQISIDFEVSSVLALDQQLVKVVLVGLAGYLGK